MDNPATSSDGSTPPPLPVPLESVRLDLISTAINFLNDEKVEKAPLSMKIAFLKGKGLNKDEIDLALLRTTNTDILENKIGSDNNQLE